MTTPGDDLARRLQTGLPERYRLEREIGRGGMAVVYLARERNTPAARWRSRSWIRS
jgi:serine/threonine protein kinase